NQGVLVGESYEDRLKSRKWGAHFPRVAGIAGRSKHASQPIALSGGNADDERVSTQEVGAETPV
ncbi:hypothetical protein MKW92_026246, partial [Papaver armeniacum]